ncbi:MAG: hypothetical protein JXA91_07715 [Candidatus Thermoplasmatota archaeon]|nr:hypothetical protein [Candidatus Thermoplasmatota archaeon]
MEYSKNGIIGFFDILGYKEILTNNEIAYTLQVIQEFFNSYEQKLINLHANQDPTSMMGSIRNLLNFSESAIFSDTILFCLPLGEDNSPICWITFLEACRNLCWDMFIKGIPLRGGIAIGEYFLKDRYIAGKPFIEAHNACSVQQWAGCAFTPSAANSLLLAKKKDITQIILNRAAIEYQVPIKSKTNNTNCFPSLALNWLNYSDSKEIFKNNSIANVILSKFNEHGKKITDTSVEEKVANTTKFLEYCNSI